MLPVHRDGRTVVVFDVLRATTTMTAALQCGVKSIRIFGDIESAKIAFNNATDLIGKKLLCGEVNCLPPMGFDLGNSPHQFDKNKHVGLTLFLSTTNGTKAILAATGAKNILVGALVNATAIAKAAVATQCHITLLCAGTNGDVSMEDLLGAGAVIAGISRLALKVKLNEQARIAGKLFNAYQDHPLEILEDSAGGKNLAAVGLSDDIKFCANLNSHDIVGVVKQNPSRVEVG